MTQRAFDKAVSNLLADFRSRLRAALRVADPGEQRRRVKEVKVKWKEEHGTYFVEKYEVQAHFRKIPVRRAPRA